MILLFLFQRDRESGVKKKKRVSEEFEGFGRDCFAKELGEDWLVRSIVLHRGRVKSSVPRKRENRGAQVG